MRKERKLAGRFLSLGAGVQSTALLLMCLHGKVEADGAIFADTGDEPRAVYEHLWKLAEYARQVRPGFPIIITSQPESLSASFDRPGAFIPIPYHTFNEKGGKTIGRRQCTYQFKIRPIRWVLRKHLSGKTGGKYVEVLIGISTDEIGRAKPASVQYVRNTYPLIDRNMSRSDCDAYNKSWGWHTVPRSACVYCPLRADDEWRALDSDELDRAVNLEERMRANDARFGGEVYFHRSRIPLRDVSFGESGGEGLTDAECSGSCFT